MLAFAPNKVAASLKQKARPRRNLASGKSDMGARMDRSSFSRGNGTYNKASGPDDALAILGLKNHLSLAAAFHWKPLLCDMDAHIVAGERRMLARAQLRETRPGAFSITPFYLRELNGSSLVWSKPAPSEAINSGRFETSFDDAQSVLALWAKDVLATSGERK